MVTEFMEGSDVGVRVEASGGGVLVRDRPRELISERISSKLALTLCTREFA